ncbi:hypothetical protein IO98_11490 [Lacrimispora celerecrescens]|uniref:Uncharacterized protein n=1 Tax=Lacrimispora celerecrescens TaxID=29354 RepID=A0A084JMC2_9FIRM|nr:hypothetical protein IO98_11490 [Lacrimispora celerecrescens]
MNAFFTKPLSVRQHKMEVLLIVLRTVAPLCAKGVNTQTTSVVFVAVIYYFLKVEHLNVVYTMFTICFLIVQLFMLLEPYPNIKNN